MQHSLQFFSGPFLCADKVSSTQISFHIRSFLLFCLSSPKGVLLHIRHDPGTRLSREGLAYGFGHGNQRSISTSFEIADDSFNLWPHTTLGKMTLFVVPPGISSVIRSRSNWLGFLKFRAT